ncbi:hypothetical protein [Vallitalea okinawensis]|uniref:hypothetical protein n=1 Tax=Vallitalea okinawensis TaxID=2078660 RepID=UPI000CFAAFDE|nr:hypothetical protein [Vallitalea okinawensis]
MTLFIENFFAILFLVIGLSHAIHPEKWSEFFARLGKFEHAAFAIAIFTLPSGLVILLLHNQWQLNSGLFITIAGWIMTIKSVIYFLNPSKYKVKDVTPQLIRSFRIVGLVMAILSVFVLIQNYLFI